MTIAGYSAADSERFSPEPPGTTARSAFARDRARVLHSAGLRRLAAKTQVHVAGEADFPRTRLTHTLEVAQIGRELALALGCDPDLVDVAGLAHDLGHPPFGHNGEQALDDVCANIGGFEGNAQTLRVLTRLEAKVVDEESGASVGLNLTRAALDAACKYPWPRHEGKRKFGVYLDDLPVFTWLRDGAPHDQRCLEAQVMDWADDVAYSVHDLEDAVFGEHFDLRAFASPTDMSTVVDVAHTLYARDLDVEFLRAASVRLAELPWMPSGFDGSHAGLAALKGLTSRLIGRFCAAAETATREHYPQFPLARYAANLVVPEHSRAEVAILKAITAHHVMFREGVEPVYAAQRELLTELVHALVAAGPDALEPWLRPTAHEALNSANPNDEFLRVVVDQVASLTDVSAPVWHDRLCS